MAPGALELMNVSGYVYKVERTGFYGDEQCGLYVNNESVPIIVKEYIENVWDKLQTFEHNFNIVRYRSKAE